MELNSIFLLLTLITNFYTSRMNKIVILIIILSLLGIITSILYNIFSPKKVKQRLIKKINKKNQEIKEFEELLGEECGVAQEIIKMVVASSKVNDIIKAKKEIKKSIIEKKKKNGY